MLGLLLRTALLNDKLIQTKFLCSALKDLLLDGILSDKAEDHDLLRLTNTMCTIHGLKIRLWIPIAIKEHNNIGSCQIDAETTSTGCEQEEELLGAWLVVLIDCRNTVFVCRRPVDTAVLISSHDTVILQDIQYTTHLGENKHSSCLAPACA